MSYNYTLKYRTFDQLVTEAKSDFRKYDLDDLIQNQDLIKVARRVNYDLGLRIQQTREVVLELNKGRVKLPNDFQILNFALVCGEFEFKVPSIQGTHIEERIIEPQGPQYQPAPPEVIDVCNDPVTPDPCNPCPQCQSPCCDDVCEQCSVSAVSCALNCKGETVQLVQVLKNETRFFKTLRPIKILNNAMDIDCDCPNLYWETPISGWIKDGWLYTNFEEGKVYLNYQGQMEDDHGNLVVLDHEMINEYYEYALKQRILENLIMNDEPVSPGKIQLIEQRYRSARTYALSIVNTPNFAELKQMWKKNRRAQWDKYYNMFRSFPFAGGINSHRDIHGISNFSGSSTV